MKRSVVWFFMLCCLPYYANAELSGELNSAFFVNHIYDNNLFRYANEAEAQGDIPSDQIRMLGATVSGDFLYFRQKVKTNLTVYDVSYSEFNFLNYQGGNGEINWSWLRGKQWNGQLQFTGSRSRTQNSDYSFLNDTITQLGTIFSAKHKFTQQWRLGIRAKFDRSNHRSEQLASANRNIAGLRTELSHINKAQTNLSGFVEYLNGHFPDRRPNENLANEFDQLHGGGQIIIFPRKNDRLMGQLGLTGRNNKQSTRDFTGIIGKFAYRLNVSNKTQIELNLFRDVLNSDDVAANYFVKYEASTEILWAATSNIQLFADFSVNRNQYNLESSLSDRIDYDKSLSLGVSYSPYKVLFTRVTFKNISKSSSVELLEYQVRQMNLELQLQF